MLLQNPLALIIYPNGRGQRASCVFRCFFLQLISLNFPARLVSDFHLTKVSTKRAFLSCHVSQTHSYYPPLSSLCRQFQSRNFRKEFRRKHFRCTGIFFAAKLTLRISRKRRICKKFFSIWIRKTCQEIIRRCRSPKNHISFRIARHDT